MKKIYLTRPQRAARKAANHDTHKRNRAVTREINRLSVKGAIGHAVETSLELRG